MYLRQYVAPALLAGGDGDLPPMFAALCGSFGRQPRHAAFSVEWLYFRNAQLGGFLDHPVHFFAARQRLRQQDLQWRFAVDVAGGNLADNHALAAEFGYHTMACIAQAIEHFHAIPLAQTQHARGMMRRFGRQIEQAAERKRWRTVEARHGQVANEWGGGVII